MTARPPPHDSRAETVEEDGRVDDQSPMDRFRGLARELINVSRENLKREEERYAVQNAARKGAPKTKGKA